MCSIESTAHRDAIGCAVFAALLAICLAVQPDGIWISPDGSAYWQGALSLASGHGYRYLSGAPITDWPPLYSLYLAAFVRAIGPSVVALVVSQAVLVGAQAALWTALCPSPWTAIYIGLFVGIFEPNPLAHVLVYILLPVLLWAWRRDSLGLATVVAVLLVATHYMAIGFVAVGAVLMARRSLWRASCFALPPATAFIACRWLLHQAARHPLGHGRFVPLAYVLQAWTGIGALLVGHNGFPAVLAMAALIGACVARRPAFAAFAWLSVAALVVLFNLTWIHDPLTGRFLWFVPLTLVPPLLMRTRPSWIAIALIAPLLSCAIISNPLALPDVQFLATSYPAIPNAANDPALLLPPLPLPSERNEARTTVNSAAVLPVRLHVGPTLAAVVCTK